MNPLVLILLQKLFDDDYCALSCFSQDDLSVLRLLWRQGSVHFNETTKRFNITPNGCLVLGKMTMPERPTADGGIVLFIEASREAA